MDTTFDIKGDTTALHGDVAAQRKRSLIEWICAVDYHEQHRDYIDRHYTGTGQWFLNDAKFQDWIASKDATLFCPGIPGAGKTIMASLVIDHLLRARHSTTHPVVFIYCDYKRQSEQSIKHMLSSILRQIVDTQAGLPLLVQEFHAFHTTRRTTPSTDETRQLLQGVLRSLLGLTLVVDALDECDARVRHELLSTVIGMCKQYDVRLMATSRFLPDVESHPCFLGKPSLEVKASREDLERYVRSRARELHQQVLSKHNLLENLVSSTVNATGGMYVRSNV
jgi:hypothetical protein